MAYAGRMPDRNKTLTVITVAGLHGMALYGLVTGLGVDYVDKVATVLTGKNIPLDPPSPPPSPEVTPAAQASTTARPTQHAEATRVDALPNDFSAGKAVIDFPIKPIEPSSIDPMPTASATPEKPSFTPKSVRPRNDPGSWVSTADYPSASLRRGEQGLVRFEAAVGPDGRVTDCRVTASSGAADLDAATCKYVTKRARFEPATDSAGARVNGTYAGSIRWVIPKD